MPFSSPLRPPAPRQLFPSLRENLHASSAPQRLLTCSMPALAQRKRLRGHSFAHCPLRAGPGPKPLHMLLLLSPPEQAVRSPPSEVILLVLVVADHVGGFQELAQREALEDLAEQHLPSLLTHGSRRIGSARRSQYAAPKLTHCRTGRALYCLYHECSGFGEGVVREGRRCTSLSDASAFMYFSSFSLRSLISAGLKLPKNFLGGNSGS
eukprot:2588675-Rhodomonas_salina.1